MDALPSPGGHRDEPLWQMVQLPPNRRRLAATLKSDAEQVSDTSCARRAGNEWLRGECDPHVDAPLQFADDGRHVAEVFLLTQRPH